MSQSGENKNIYEKSYKNERKRNKEAKNINDHGTLDAYEKLQKENEELCEIIETL